MNRIQNFVILFGILILLLVLSCKSESQKNDLALSRVNSVSSEKIFFPVGYYSFHEDQLFNFNLNRWHSMGFARFVDMQEAGKRIKTFKDWKIVMKDLAKKAESENRLVNAAFYYRAAEFFLKRKEPEKEILYNKFNSLFYAAFKKDKIEKHRVPYKNSYLPAIKIAHGGEKKKGVVVIHGGFDSFIEELYFIMKYISNHGYEVIAFEGPGQGSAVKKYKHYLDYRWEKPTGAVLDYFKLDDVTLIGISLGGYLCIRAAAFEPRIKHVIASSVAFDHGKITSVFEQLLVKFLFKYFRDFTNRSVKKKMKGSTIVSWSIGNMMYIANKKEPIEALDVMLTLNEKNLHSEKVKQDVLILTGKDDHLIPYKMHSKQIKALLNARSVTGRVFTKKEHAANHCQVGNLGLALDTMLDWLDKKSK